MTPGRAPRAIETRPCRRRTGRCRPTSRVPTYTTHLRQAAALALLALLGLAFPALRPGSATPQVWAATPAVTVNPQSGPVGTTIQISASGFPSSDRATVTLDGATVAGAVAMNPCPVVGGVNGFGFGPGCNDAPPKSAVAPASPGTHTITVSQAAAGGGQIAASAQFTVMAPTATCMPTSPPSNTPTTTPTSTPTSASTSTPAPATTTPSAGPPTPRATATNTPLPPPTATPALLSVLVYPLHLFGGGLLALSLRAPHGSHIQVTFELIAAGTTGRGKHKVPRGTILYRRTIHATAGSAGRYASTLHISYRPHVRAGALLLVTIQHGGASLTARRTFT